MTEELEEGICEVCGAELDEDMALDGMCEECYIAEQEYLEKD